MGLGLGLVGLGLVDLQNSGLQSPEQVEEGYQEESADPGSSGLHLIEQGLASH